MWSAIAGMVLVACAPDATIAAIGARTTDASPPIDSAPVETGCAHGRGPDMVDVGGYCIDLTEVTKAQYAAFLAAPPSPSSQAPECAWNVDFAPHRTSTTDFGGDTSCDETLDPDVNDATKFPARPMVCVDWCDAAAYCAWAGKRLCGARGGKSDGIIDDSGNTLNDASKSEWYSACIGPRATAYPYGATFDATACFMRDDTVTAPVDVASEPACHGPAGTPNAAIYDLSGNVAEWTNACRAAGDGRTTPCEARGGWWKDTRPGAAACAVDPLVKIVWGRGRADNHIGFRCCSG